MVTQVVSAYASKPETYYATHNHNIFDLLPTGPSSSILELGCGSGEIGARALRDGKASRYVGIEIEASAARKAKLVLSEVLCGDIDRMDVSNLYGDFDVLVASEVLEHLENPWGSLAKLALCLKPGGMVFASSPNISHYRVIGQLLRGNFEYQKFGVMDETHLRWFTPSTYSAMFERAGFEIISVEPMAALRPRAKFVNAITFGRLKHLFTVQTTLVGRLR